MDSSHIPDEVGVFYWTAVNGTFYNLYWALWAAVKGAKVLITLRKNWISMNLVNLGLSYILHGTVLLSGGFNEFPLGKRISCL